MPRQPEKEAVENYIVNKLVEKGWKFVLAKDLGRESYEEPLLINNLVAAIKKINKLELGDEDIKHVLNELRLKGTGQEGHKQILNYLKKGISIKLEKAKDLVRINLFDYNTVDNNEYIVTRQTIFYAGHNEIRNDILLYINGIPLVNIECKDPGNINASWEAAYNDIKEYEKAIPELYKYVQIGVGAESIARYFPIVPWLDNVHTYEWKEEGKFEVGKDISMVSLIEMLSKHTLLDLIKNYLFFREERGKATKVIARYMQYRAAEKIVKRVLDNIHGKTDKNKGLIWHWQGSGKTLTMIFAANKLYFSRELENPTVFFILDRDELQRQLYDEFNYLDITKVEKPISSIKELRSILKYDEGRGKRGLFIVLVHKFRTEELEQLENELKERSKENETILNRRNILAFVDEGHRTQYGLLAAQMKSILRSAFFFAFTGTPIAKKEKDTYREFSYPAEKEFYLDKYFVTDSEHDGFTVKIVYQPRLERDVWLKKDMLNAFLAIEEEELPERIREDVKENIKKKLSIAKIILENPDRIKKITKDIAEHFKENVDGKFKAMIVAVNRKACVYYKRELDKLLPPEYSEVVMTFTQTDPQEIRKYREELQARYPNKEFGEIKEEITGKFKDEQQNPKILIVTDMLITGFDAPVLQTLYLDKPLKEHKLLQTIARTNRPFKDAKEAGLIVDYLGILKDFKKAFELYGKDAEGILYDKEEVRKEFENILKEMLSVFTGISKDYSRENILKAIEILADEEKAKQFTRNFKNLRKKFELLGADIGKLPYLSDLKWLAYIYHYYLKELYQNENYEDNQFIEKYFSKTIKYIHRTIEIENLKKDLPIIDFDENYLKRLEEKAKTKEEKAANIVFTLNRMILVERYKNPLNETLAEKVQRLVELWKEKTKDFKKIYEEGIAIIQERNKLLFRKNKLGLNDFEYYALMLLEDLVGKKDKLVSDIKIFYKVLRAQLFHNWYLQTTTRKNIEREIRKFLIKCAKEYGFSLNKVDEMSIKLLETLRAHGES